MKSLVVGRWAVRWVAVAGVLCMAAGAVAEEPRPDRVREEIRRLEHRVQELKADGKVDEARAVEREAAELREKSGRMERERHAEGAGGEERRRDEMKRKLDASRAELKELREAGKEDQAAEMQRRIHSLEETLANSGRRPEGERGTAAHQERGATERRVQHVREAIAHLREAGMNDLAERLDQEADRMMQQRGGGDERRRPDQAGAEIERMRAELQELRQAVRQLNARLDGANRERPDVKKTP